MWLSTNVHVTTSFYYFQTVTFGVNINHSVLQPVSQRNLFSKFKLNEACICYKWDILCVFTFEFGNYADNTAPVYVHMEMLISDLYLKKTLFYNIWRDVS